MRDFFTQCTGQLSHEELIPNYSPREFAPTHLATMSSIHSLLCNYIELLNLKIQSELLPMNIRSIVKHASAKPNKKSRTSPKLP